MQKLDNILEFLPIITMMDATISQRIMGELRLIDEELLYLNRESQSYFDESPITIRALQIATGEDLVAIRKDLGSRIEVSQYVVTKVAVALSEGKEEEAKALLRYAKKHLTDTRAFWLALSEKGAWAARKTEALTKISALALSMLAGGLTLAGTGVFAGTGSFALAGGFSLGLHATAFEIAEVFQINKAKPLDVSISHDVAAKAVEAAKEEVVVVAKKEGPPKKQDLAKEWVDRAIAQPVEKSLPKHDIGPQLIDFARVAIREWRENPQRRHRYGHFLIDSESDGVDPAKLHQMWDAELTELRAKLSVIPDSWERFNKMMFHIFPKFLQIYVREQTQLTGILQNMGGNCQAQTELLLSAIEDLELELPAGNKVAIQFLADHVQLVLYNTRTGIIFNPMTREEMKETLVPLYDPHIIFNMFLKSRGVVAEFEDAQFIIALANAGKEEFAQRIKRHKARRPSIIDKYAPKSTVHFSGSEPPDFAFILSPYEVADKNRVVATGSGGELQLSATEYDTPDYVIARNALSMEEVKKTDPEIAEKTFSSPFGFLIWKGHYVFRDKMIADAFNMIEISFLGESQAYAKRFHLLKPLIFAGLRSIIDDNARELEIMEDPSVLSGLDLKDIKEPRILEALGGAYGKISHALADYCGGFSSSSFADSNKAYNRCQEDIDPIFSVFKDVLWRRGASLQKRVSDNPPAFILFINRLDHERRVLFLEMLKEWMNYRQPYLYPFSDAQSVDSSIKSREKFVNAVGDRNLIRIVLGDKKRSSTEFIPIQVRGAGPLLEVPVDLKRALPQPKKVDPFDDSNAPYEISLETFLDISFIFGEERIFGRWSPQILSHFAKIGRDTTRWDNDFEGWFYVLSGHYKDSGSLVSYMASYPDGKLTIEEKSWFKMYKNFYGDWPPPVISSDLAAVMRLIRSRLRQTRQKSW